jgi:ATP-dependent RNA helicase DDX35
VIQNQMMCRGVVFVAGEPGRGKTTGVPWELTKTFQRVACCLPRRLQAKMAATYVRRLHGDRGVPDPDIGWAVGGEKSQHGRKLTYFTHGCFIRHVGQRVTSQFDVVIVDEAHEQSMEAQMVIYLLRDALAKHGKPKIVVMSATMDAKEFWDYFREGLPEASRLSILGQEHQTVELGTRPHGVQVLRLDDFPGSFARDQRGDELCKRWPSTCGLEIYRAILRVI